MTDDSALYIIYIALILYLEYIESRRALIKARRGFLFIYFIFFLCAVFVSATSDRRMKKTEEQRNKKYQTERERERSRVFMG